MKTNLENITPLWETNPIWGTLSYEDKLYVEPYIRVQAYKNKEFIFQENDEPTTMMTLVSGKVRMQKGGLRNQQIVKLLSEGDVFGYGPILGDEKHRNSAIAFEPCVVYHVEREAFEYLMQRNVRFCFAVTQLLAQEIANSEDRAMTLTQKNMRGRLADAILLLLDKYGFDEDGVTISLYLSRDDLARMSNMTTANAIRTLSQFGQEGVVSIDGRKIKVMDLDALNTISRMG